jgi:hypothetical protein
VTATSTSPYEDTRRRQDQHGRADTILTTEPVDGERQPRRGFVDETLQRGKREPERDQPAPAAHVRPRQMQNRARAPHGPDM